MRLPSSNQLLLGTLLIAAGMIGYGLWKGSEVKEVQRVGFQSGDFPLEMPEHGAVDQRFHFMSAWDVAKVPMAARFDSPMGTQNGGFVYNAQKFWEMNVKRGGHHTGDDLNGIGGMNTDLGDPVYAAADGLVVYGANPSPGWGNILIVAHRTTDGRMLHSMYAHLLKRLVVPGMIVSRGQKIAEVGTADGMYPAHLHFEMRESDGADIGAGYAMVTLNRLDPMGTVNALRGHAEADLAPSFLQSALATSEGWTGLEIQGAEKFLGR